MVGLKNILIKGDSTAHPEYGLRSPKRYKAGCEGISEEMSKNAGQKWQLLSVPLGTLTSTPDVENHFRKQ